jgi:hypothetical protein
MQMFRLVKNTAIVIGWLTTPGHSWFGKNELRQIKYLMGDLGHPHIFTVILVAGQYLFILFYFVDIFNLIDF